VVAQPPVISSSGTASGTNREAFTTYILSATPTNTVTKFGMTTNLPAGLVFDATLGTISGTPFITNTFTNTLFFTNTIFATNSGGSTNKSLVISIAPGLTTFARFLSASGVSGANAQADADPDGDGHNNLTEFAFGMRPEAKDQVPAKAVATGNNLKLFFNRRVNSSEVSYVVESTTSLSAPNWTVEALTPSPESDGASVPSGYQRVSVSLPTSPGSAKFYRVRGVVHSAAFAAP